MRQLSYIEMDLDLYRITAFDEINSGDPVRNWTKQWDPNTALVGLIDSTLPRGKGVRLTRTNAVDTLTLWRWDLIPSILNVSTVALLRTSGAAATTSLELAVRATGTSAATAQGYKLQIFNGLLVLTKIVGGVPGALTTMPFVWNSGQPYWMRLDAVNITGGVLVRAKVWQGEMSDEPSTFTIFATDSSSPINTPGFVGVSSFFDEDVIDVAFYRARSLLLSTPETVRHAKPDTYRPREIIAIPDLDNITLSPSEVALGESLGTRAKVTLRFEDHPGSDLGELINSGSHWGKFRARQLFRRGADLRLKFGSAGQSINDMETHHYVLESFNGPTRDGMFTLVAQDMLKLADNDRAQCPRLSNGFLSANLAAGVTSVTLQPTGIGAAEYGALGFAAIGGTEIVQYTRVGTSDTFNLVRGVGNTADVAHNQEDRFQDCVLFNAFPVDQIIAALLVGFAGMDPSLIPSADWALEVGTYLPFVYTRFLAEPVGVSKLITELIEQAGLAVWPDVIANKVRLQVLRGIPTTSFEYNQTNTLRSSISPQEQPAKQFTQAWTYYGLINPLQPTDEPNNYRSARKLVDTEGESALGQAIIHKTFASWIPAFASGNADRVNNLQLSRFSKPPRRVTWAVQRHSEVPLPEMGAGYRVRWDGNQQEWGKDGGTPVQVVRVTHSEDKVEAEGEEMLFRAFDPVDLQDRVITIDSSISNIHLPTLHNSLYPALTPADVVAGVTLTVNVRPGVLVTSSSPFGHCFNVGEASDWPPGMSITIVMHSGSRMQAWGGNGGYSLSDGTLIAPTVGGNAFRTRVAIFLDNQAQIFAGAGGGGYGASPGGGGMGGGGAGFPAGNGGPTWSPLIPAGSTGTADLGGAGGFRPMAQGGKGGDAGQPGVNGSGTTVIQLGAGQGNAIDGVGFITFTNVGDIRGLQI